MRLSKSVVGAEEIEAVSRVIEAQYLGMGHEVQQFENEIKDYLGTAAEVVCVSTGTVAIQLALEALDIGVGDEVLVPSITYVASFQAISATGATPIACDVTSDKVFIDLEDAERRLTVNTKAILPVHWASNSADMNAVYDFARSHNLRVVEDAAQAFGCLRDGEKVGTKGDVICFSFDGIKNITSGEGGAVLAFDSVVAQRIRDARLLGVEKDTEQRYQGKRSWAFDVHRQGWRSHMSNIMAAIGRAQLKKINSFAVRRRSYAKSYVELLSPIREITIFGFDYSQILPHIFTIRVQAEYRDALKSFLEKEGIESGIHYQPNHLLSFFKTSYSLEQSEKLWTELLTLPLHPDLSEADIIQVAHLIHQFFKNHA